MVTTEHHNLKKFFCVCVCVWHMLRGKGQHFVPTFHLQLPFGFGG